MRVCVHVRMHVRVRLCVRVLACVKTCNNLVLLSSFRYIDVPRRFDPECVAYLNIQSRLPADIIRPLLAPALPMHAGKTFNKFIFASTYV